MKKLFASLVLFSYFAQISAQKYEFQTLSELPVLEVLDQGKTGTCWSFSSISFLEAEILRKTGQHVNLSEMFPVRATYEKKAYTYIMRQGKAQFGEGGLNHDVLHTIRTAGLVPAEIYSGRKPGAAHDHSKLVAELTPVVERNAKKTEAGWKQQVRQIIDAHLGPAPENFVYQGKTFTPMTFLEWTGLRTDDYITVSSFSHAPFYETFVLDVPDNFSNEAFYNVSLEDWIKLIDDALANGFSLALDADVSEDTFWEKEGLAVMPAQAKDAAAMRQQIGTEMHVTQEIRQREFENFNTMDDHLMHITGTASDQNGNRYYLVKNSWGKRSGKNGYIYMSAAYLKLKGISVMLHKDALKPELRAKLKI